MGIAALWIRIPRKNIRPALRGAGYWRGDEWQYIRSRPRTMWASRGVKCLDKHAVHVSWSSPPH